MVVDGVYRTSDLVEASVLSMHGLTPAFEMTADERKALFIFTLADDDDPEFVNGLLVELKGNTLRIEPKRFARELRHVRQCLYDYLGVNRERLRLR